MFIYLYKEDIANSSKNHLWTFVTVNVSRYGFICALRRMMPMIYVNLANLKTKSMLMSPFEHYILKQHVKCQTNRHIWSSFIGTILVISGHLEKNECCPELSSHASVFTPSGRCKYFFHKIEKYDFYLNYLLFKTLY